METTKIAPAVDRRGCLGVPRRASEHAVSMAVSGGTGRQHGGSGDISGIKAADVVAWVESLECDVA